MSLLEIQDIHTYYGESYILQGVSLAVEEGSLVALVGRNGVGKTTLIHSIIGFSPPKRGKIIFRGQDITHWQPFRIARLGISLVPQGRRIFSSLTTRENLEVGARRQGNAWWSLDKVLAIFPQLQGRLRSRGGQLSGGEQQMLATGRALMNNPTLLLLDEPSTGLAPMVVQELGRIILDLEGLGTSILLVEQNLPFALKLADYVYVMSKGTIVHQSTPRELEENTEVKLRYLGV